MGPSFGGSLLGKFISRFNISLSVCVRVCFSKVLNSGVKMVEVLNDPAHIGCSGHGFCRTIFAPGGCDAGEKWDR